MANSKERLLHILRSALKYPWHGYYSHISIENHFSVACHILIIGFLFTPSTGRVNTWLLCAVLETASRDLYFTFASKTPSLARVQQRLTFLLSRHPVWPRLRLSRQPLSSRLPAEKSHSSRPAGEPHQLWLGTVLHLKKDWLLLWNYFLLMPFGDANVCLDPCVTKPEKCLCVIEQCVSLLI